MSVLVTLHVFVFRVIVAIHMFVFHVIAVFVFINQRSQEVDNVPAIVAPASTIIGSNGKY